MSDLADKKRRLAAGESPESVWADDVAGIESREVRRKSARLRARCRDCGHSWPVAREKLPEPPQKSGFRYATTGRSFRRQGDGPEEWRDFEWHGVGDGHEVPEPLVVDADGSAPTWWKNQWGEPRTGWGGPSAPGWGAAWEDAEDDGHPGWVGRRHCGACASRDIEILGNSDSIGCCDGCGKDAQRSRDGSCVCPACKAKAGTAHHPPLGFGSVRDAAQSYEFVSDDGHESLSDQDWESDGVAWGDRLLGSSPVRRKGSGHSKGLSMPPFRPLRKGEKLDPDRYEMVETAIRQALHKPAKTTRRVAGRFTDPVEGDDGPRGPGCDPDEQGLEPLCAIASPKPITPPRLRVLHGTRLEFRVTRPLWLADETEIAEPRDVCGDLPPSSVPADSREFRPYTRPGRLNPLHMPPMAPPKARRVYSSEAVRGYFAKDYPPAWFDTARFDVDKVIPARRRIPVGAVKEHIIAPHGWLLLADLPWPPPTPCELYPALSLDMTYLAVPVRNAAWVWELMVLDLLAILRKCDASLWRPDSIKSAVGISNGMWDLVQHRPAVRDALQDYRRWAEWGRGRAERKFQVRRNVLDPIGGVMLKLPPSYFANLRNAQGNTGNPHE